MRNQDKTKGQLINELVKMRQRVAELEKTETGPKKADEVLYKSEELFRAVIRGAPIAVFALNRKGVFTLSEGQGLNILGLMPEEVIGRSIFEVYRDKPKILKGINQVLAGKAFISNVEMSGFTFEMRCSSVMGQSGKVAGVIGVATDITKRKKRQAALLHAAGHWRTTFDSITDMISIHDKDFKIISVNKSFANAFKMKPQECLGKACYELVHGTKEPWPDCPHKETLETKRPTKIEFFEPHLDAYLEVSTSPIFNKKNEVVSSVHITKDITERRKTEEETQKQLKELEIFYKANIGREERILELKKKVRELEGKLREK